jgi:hypothetical protein
MLETTLHTGRRFSIGEHSSEARTELVPVLARSEQREVWSHVVGAYLMLDATRAYAGPPAER